MKVYFIVCRTRCSCCSNENHVRGVWTTLERALNDLRYCYETVQLASQYSSRGDYSLYETEAEEISNGRLIIDDKVIEPENIDNEPEDSYLDADKYYIDGDKIYNIPELYPNQEMTVCPYCKKKKVVTGKWVKWCRNISCYRNVND